MDQRHKWALEKSRNKNDKTFENKLKSSQKNSNSQRNTNFDHSFKPIQWEKQSEKYQSEKSENLVIPNIATFDKNI